METFTEKFQLKPSQLSLTAIYAVLVQKTTRRAVLLAKQCTNS